MKYTLKLNFWKNNIDLLRDGKIIGNLVRIGVWKSGAKGYLFDKNYTFLVKGIFSSRTEIMDEQENIIGEINFNHWSYKATVELNGKRYYWQSDNFWCTRWKLTDELGHEILLTKNEFLINNAISENNDFAIFLATYLFYYSYNQKMAAAV